jgi:hypothetical protein
MLDEDIQTVVAQAAGWGKPRHAIRLSPVLA